MPRLKYKIGYIDLHQDIDQFFAKLDCRTEIRKAEKSKISVRVIENGLAKVEQTICSDMLNKLLVEEKIVYDYSFDQLLARPDVFQFLAYQHGVVVSFITVEPTNRNVVFNGFKTAYLALSATAYHAKRDCPNYFLIWQAIKFLKSKGFEVFNLGLLEFIDAPDEAVSRVAFFKRKWHIIEVEVEKNVNFGKWFYYCYLKRFSIIRSFLFRLKKTFKST